MQRCGMQRCVSKGMYGKTCMQRYVLEDIWKERDMCDGKAKKRIIKSGGWKTDHGGWKMDYDGGENGPRRMENGL